MTATDTTSPASGSDAAITALCRELATNAQRARQALAGTGGGKRTAALQTVANQLRNQTQAIIEANRHDLSTAEEDRLSPAMIDRLRVDTARVEKMAQSVAEIADQTDPVGQVICGYVRPNGLHLEKVRTPIGVVLIIYESRPNVTSDAAALCLKSGNAVVLRGGKEAKHTNGAVARTIRNGLEQAEIDPDCVQLVESTDRRAVGELLKLEGLIDLAIPRGGESLIRAVVEQARIPVIKHYTGNCQIYVDATCDDAMAADICVNAKVQRPGVCNAVETLLFHRAAAERGLLTKVCQSLTDAGVEIRGDQATRRLFEAAAPAAESDWAEEYLDLICAIRVVDSIAVAIEHINRYGSKHTDAIVTNAVPAAAAFVNGVDSANVFVNCSTRFSDGGEYGLGAEIGISTDKLHARGPMGADDLTTYKWVVRGQGQIRQ